MSKNVKCQRMLNVSLKGIWYLHRRRSGIYQRWTSVTISTISTISTSWSFPFVLAVVYTFIHCCWRVLDDIQARVESCTWRSYLLSFLHAWVVKVKNSATILYYEWFHHLNRCWRGKLDTSTTNMSANLWIAWVMLLLIKLQLRLRDFFIRVEDCVALAFFPTVFGVEVFLSSLEMLDYFFIGLKLPTLSFGDVSSFLYGLTPLNGEWVSSQIVIHLFFLKSHS